jgi:hypothetical protein
MIDNLSSVSFNVVKVIQPAVPVIKHLCLDVGDR